MYIFLRGSGWLFNHDKEIIINNFVRFANTMPTVEEDDGEIRPMCLEEMSKQLKKE